MKVMFALAERAGHPVEKDHPELIAAVYEGALVDAPDWYGHEIKRALQRSIIRDDVAQRAAAAEETPIIVLAGLR